MAAYRAFNMAIAAFAALLTAWSISTSDRNGVMMGAFVCAFNLFLGLKK